MVVARKGAAMEVAVWQTGIILTIVLASYLFGLMGWMGSIVILAVWTIVMVFTSWLMILQFITIAVGAFAGMVLIGRKKSEKEQAALQAAMESVVIFGALAIGGSFYLLSILNPEQRFAFDLGTLGIRVAYTAALLGAAVFGGGVIWVVSGSAFGSWRRETFQYGGALSGLVLAFVFVAGNDQLKQRGLRDGAVSETHNRVATSTIATPAAPIAEARSAGSASLDSHIATTFGEYAVRYPQYDPKSVQYDPTLAYEALTRKAFYQPVDNLKEREALKKAMQDMSQPAGTRVSIQIVHLGGGICRFNSSGQRRFVSLEGTCPTVGGR